MAFNLDMLNMLFDATNTRSLSELSGKRLCELGNLFVRPDVNVFLESKGLPTFAVAKELFTYFGIDDVSIDLNGKNGALKIDLGKPITDKSLLNSFDLLINGGTTEHVYDQYECWNNVHNLCKVEAIVVSLGPLEGNWRGHSPWHCSLEFFKKLADECNYDTIENRIGNFKGKGFDCYYVVTRKKDDASFVSRKWFVEMWNELHIKKIEEELEEEENE